MSNHEFKEFDPFPKIFRLFKSIIISEKIDGINSQIAIEKDGTIRCGHRSNWVNKENDTYGFNKWVNANRSEILKLGSGRFYGEWWGSGIQRRYNQKEKRFSLYNPYILDNLIDKPNCIDTVPILYNGEFKESKILDCLNSLKLHGSFAAHGFQNPEGIVVFHVHSNISFKLTLDYDKHKWEK